MKSLSESLKTSINEVNEFPKNNIICPATVGMGTSIVVIGNPFTINDRAGWQKAFNLVKAIFPKSEIGWGWDSLDGINGNMVDAMDPDDLTDDGVNPKIQLVYAHNPEFLGNRQGSIACFPLDEVDPV